MDLPGLDAACVAIIGSPDASNKSGYIAMELGSRLGNVDCFVAAMRDGDKAVDLLRKGILKTPKEPNQYGQTLFRNILKQQRPLTISSDTQLTVDTSKTVKVTAGTPCWKDGNASKQDDGVTLVKVRTQRPPFATGYVDSTLLRPATDAEMLDFYSIRYDSAKRVWIANWSPQHTADDKDIDPSKY